jgi:hypothetical protein
MKLQLKACKICGNGYSLIPSVVLLDIFCDSLSVHSRYILENVWVEYYTVFAMSMFFCAV